MSRSWQVNSHDETRALGREVGRRVQGGEVILLSGDLGAGKTVFVKGLAEGLGITEIINSPTFTLIRPHEGRLKLQHVDLYRLASSAECEELGLNDLAGPDSVLAIEWPERGAGDWPEALRLSFEFGSNEQQRRITCLSNAPWLADLPEQLP